MVSQVHKYNGVVAFWAVSGGIIYAYSSHKNSYFKVYVSSVNILSDIVRPYLIPGERVEFDLFQDYYARNVIGINGTCLECDKYKDRAENVLR